MLPAGKFVHLQYLKRFARRITYLRCKLSFQRSPSFRNNFVTLDLIGAASWLASYGAEAPFALSTEGF
jgi:hypothetical protein